MAYIFDSLNLFLDNKGANLEHDEFISEVTINLSLPFGNYSNHKISKYRAKEGEFKGREYYVFDWLDGVAIMNYTHFEYKELFKYLYISPDEPIFSMCSKHKNYNLNHVPEEYRLRAYEK